MTTLPRFLESMLRSPPRPNGTQNRNCSPLILPIGGSRRDLATRIHPMSAPVRRSPSSTSRDPMIAETFLVTAATHTTTTRRAMSRPALYANTHIVGLRVATHRDSHQSRLTDRTT